MRICSVNAVVIAGSCRIPAGDECADIGVPENISFHSPDEERIRRGRTGLLGFHGNKAEIVLVHLATEPGTADNWNRCSGGIQADTAAEKRNEIPAGTKCKRADVLEKEVAFLGKEQVESCQVNLLLV